MRNLIICCDGTWNTPDQTAGELPAPTNVVRFYNALAEHDGQGGEQLAYYHPGVGTEGNWWQKVRGGSVGEGLDSNIKSAYRWICDHWQPDDRLFLVGFSRGAYTVRSLAGFISRCGLLDLGALPEEERWSRVRRAFAEGYRRRQADWGRGWTLRCAPVEARIQFLGVWDTVGALGIPDNLAILNLLDDRRKYAFHDTQLGDSVLEARHAVALDEMRASFAPTLWTGVAGRAGVRQLWFPGVHSDVGGGYAECGLSDGALKWMVDEAAALGLAFKPAMLAQIRPSHHGVLHDSCRGVFKLLRTQPRFTPRLHPALAGTELHLSALARSSDPPITQAPYRPTREVVAGSPVTASVYAQDRWNDTRIWLEAGVEYEFRAQGQWLSKDVPGGPAGASDDRFHKGEVAHAVASIWGKLEGLVRKATGNDVADFWGTKRVEDAPWLALVGVVAAGGEPGADGTPAKPDTFVIGQGLRRRIPRAGYFYAFANDAWNFYENNRGSVHLTVSRVDD
jgi:hypothetical protein